MPPSHRSLIRLTDAEESEILMRAPAIFIYEISEPMLDSRWTMAREITTEVMWLGMADGEAGEVQE